MAELTPEQLEQILITQMSKPKAFEDDNGKVEAHNLKDIVSVIKHIQASNRTREIQVVPIDIPGTV